ncbi:uncharacterized protein LOC143324299 [Chaetodon auriga]|uniref:uncharacterized protein LOC143324299 n=1 Tax=Chaetodon auriga TaxID=39042 RepID=UPI0040329165
MDPEEDWEAFTLVKIKMTSENEKECETYDYTSAQTDNETTVPEVTTKRLVKKRKFQDYIEGKKSSLEAYPKPPEINKKAHANIDDITDGGKSRSKKKNSKSHHGGERLHSRSGQEKSRSSREKSTSSHGSESRHSRSRQELPQTSRTPSEPFPMSTAKFQKCVLKKLVELMQEVKRIGGADPIASAYQLNRMDTLEELDATEERIQQNDERQVLITQLSRVGGKNTRDCTTKIMDRLMTNNLMATLNMKGHGTKRAFKGTKLYQVVIAAVKSWSQKATEHDISHAVADHLKHAPGHSGGGGYKAR